MQFLLIADKIIDFWIILFFGKWVGGGVVHCHRVVARPRVADGGTASNMEGSREYIE
jgi:hypothetical protein